ncbi:NlpC/P60 family protein [Chelatococcus sp. GCM10030263]|uniref:NlpC/P60 family protein n=1 Tax=Chelatococcus sp. GCM10030263 TaxID=3273387 RepID=UPI00361EE270
MTLAILARREVVAAARAWCGTPYRHQASRRGIGTDCLGLVRGLCRDLFGCEPEAPPPYAPDWAEAGRREMLAEGLGRHFGAIDPAAFGAGDVLLFRWRAHLPAGHLGIATGAGRMVHAHAGAAVAEVAIGRWWSRHLAFAFSFPGISD